MLTISWTHNIRILGFVVKLELQRDGRETEFAMEMPSCSCSVATVPRQADMKMMAWRWSPH
jgi:hypothetical protein